MIAALSANHLAALDLAPMLTRLYVARDRDAAGRMAAERLHARGRDAGIEVRDLMPARSDFNVDLRRLGPDVMLARLADQLAPADVLRFLRRRDAACPECRARHHLLSGVGPAGRVVPGGGYSRPAQGPPPRPFRAASCHNRIRTGHGVHPPVSPAGTTTAPPSYPQHNTRSTRK